MKMDLQKAIEILEKHNEWRRDENIPPKTDMQNPADIGNAIDYALIELKKMRVADVSGAVCLHESQYRTFNYESNIERCDKCGEVTN